MTRRATYSDRTQQNSPDRFFLTRRQVFMYHYVHRETCRGPGDSIDISTTGCRYLGWVQLNHTVRGEIWSYRHDRQRLMVAMLVPRTQLMWHADYLRLQKNRQKEQREWNKYIQKLAQKSFHQQHRYWE